MDISLGHVVLLVAAALVALALFRYLKLIVHLAVVLGKLILIAVAAFIVVYATGIWRPDLSPLVWLLGKLMDWVR
jgi:hypothetical protein